MSIQRWTAEDWYVRPAPTTGEYVLFTDHEAAVSEARAEAITRLEGWVPLGNRERVAQAREQAIRDCIERLVEVHQTDKGAGMADTYYLMGLEDAAQYLRALLPEGDKR